MNIGVLTGGGDAPGLNPAIRAVVRRLTGLGHTCVGFRDGWAGVANCSTLPLPATAVSGILPRGGTILGTSRLSPMNDGRATVDRCLATVRDLGIDGIAVIGGNGTLSVASRFWSEEKMNVVGVPKTIDNDIGGTDRSVGLDTAVQIATDAIDRLHTTAESHHRVMIVEVMGRDAGWIACLAGIAGGADLILVPERPFNVDDAGRRLLARRAAGKNFSIVVVAEGAMPTGGVAVYDEEPDETGRKRLGGIGHWLGHELAERFKLDNRVVVIGHIQRGGSASATDRILATRLGVCAADAAVAGRWGIAAAVRGAAVVEMPIGQVASVHPLDPELLRVAEVFFAG
jgi:6-phosphofructokinase 1